VTNLTALEPSGDYLVDIVLSLESGEILRTYASGGNIMLLFDSYRDVLSENALGHHVVTSAWFIVAAVAVFMIMWAA
jgi:hypothetical protein